MTANINPALDAGMAMPPAELPLATPPLFECGYAPGIYFGLDEDKYHAIPALSATGIKNLMVSPMDFWARSWMNPWREEDIEESEAKTIGKAYHKRILEGRDAFDRAYTTPFECFDADVLDTVSDLQKALEAMSLKKTGNKPELIERVLAAKPDAKIYDHLEKAYQETHKGKSFLNVTMFRKIELSARMIEFHHALKYYFVGGYPEVTVIWFDQESGIWFKARFDYLKTQAVNDLKTFANMLSKTIEKAVYGAMASGKYHIQAALYLRAVEIAKQFVRDGQVFALQPVDPKWLEAFANAPDHIFNFLFQQKGPAPVSVGAVFSRKDPMFDTGLACVQYGIDTFVHNFKTYGTDPWVDQRDPIVLHYQQYPAFANDF